MSKAMAAATTKQGNDDEGKPATGARRTKLVRVKQGYIDYLLANPPRPYRSMPQELIDRIRSEKDREELRALMASVAARHKRMYDQHMDFLEQYRLKGYAEEEIEISDDEEEEEEEEEEETAVVGNQA